MDFNLADLYRRIENLFRFGPVTEADYSAARVRVELGDIITDWLPWVTRRAGGDKDWWAPEVGEQVLVLAPSGDPAQAFVLPAAYQDTRPAPSNNPDIHRTEYADGCSVQYNRAAQVMDINIPSDGEINITAVGGVNITATDGNVVVNGDVIADGVSLKGHVHTGVVPGDGLSGPPQS